MANNFWKKLLGGAANALVPGEIYNSHTGQWAPSGVRTGRIAAGVAGQLGPAGTIAGMIANGVIGRSPEGFAFDQGIEGWGGITGDFSNLPQWAQRGGDAPPMQTSVQTLNPGLKGMVQPGFQVGGPFPQIGGTAPVFDTGYANTQTGYGVELPNYGPAGSPQAPSGQSGGQASQPTGDQARMDLNNQYRGAQEGFKAFRGDYASPNNFQRNVANNPFSLGEQFKF